MKLASLETTPNPNCMKLNLDEQIVDKPVSLQRGKSLDNLPQAVLKLLEIEGVKEAFLASNFITLTRQGQSDWQAILSEAARLLGVAETADLSLLDRPKDPDASSKAETGNQLGFVEVAVLVFRGLPTQVRVIGKEAQARVSLPERFNEALQRSLFATGSNYLEERQWELYPPRYGSPEAVAKMVADEVDSLIDEEELTRLERAATNSSPASVLREKTKASDLLAQLQSRDGQVRLKAIQKIEINNDTFSALVKALDDGKAAIRRWAAALLGASANPQAIEPLCRVLLNDSSAIVRRTAGDALSDLGDEKALPAMCQALEDSSQLVRWRAARFLNEAGEPTALLALRRAKERENEFDVRLEMSAAEERIEGGGERQLPMWMRLAQSEN